MTLRPGGGPARLLLELWELEQQSKRKTLYLSPSNRSRARLVLSGFIEQHVPHMRLYILTPAGREAARALQASS